MNNHPEQPIQPDELTGDPTDAVFEAALLNEAGQVEMPAQALEALQAKVIALTDPRLLSLLDEALAPEAASSELAERIIAATAPGKTQRDQGPPAVLARIQPTTWRYAAAAAIALAAGVGLWMVAQQPTAPGDELAIDDTPKPTIVTDQTDEEVFAQIVPTQIFDEVTFVVGDSALSSSSDLGDQPLDSDTIWSEMDDYVQFLSDLESDLTSPAT